MTRVKGRRHPSLSADQEFELGDVVHEVAGIHGFCFERILISFDPVTTMNLEMTRAWEVPVQKVRFIHKIEDHARHVWWYGAK